MPPVKSEKKAERFEFKIVSTEKLGTPIDVGPDWKWMLTSKWQKLNENGISALLTLQDKESNGTIDWWRAPYAKTSGHDGHYNGQMVDIKPGSSLKGKIDATKYQVQFCKFFIDAYKVPAKQNKYQLVKLYVDDKPGPKSTKYE
jgi:hypothetical protein